MAANPQPLSPMPEIEAQLAAGMKLVFGSIEPPIADACGAPLSEAERAIAEREARETDALRRKAEARRIMAEFMFDAEMPWDELIASGCAGELSAKLYATWAPRHRAEPLEESDYLHEAFPVDLGAALNSFGLDTYAERCAAIGKRIVDDARKYIFRVHGMTDAEIAEEDASERTREYRREIARRVRG